MLKKLAMIAVAGTLAACVDGGAAVTQNQSLSASCPGSQHMQTANGLPMRCGPQQVLPYTFQ